MSSLCRSIVSNGATGIIIDIECHLSNNLPTIVIVGFAGRAVNEAKDRLRGAFASSQLQLPRRRITVNLAPADIPKTESGLDLAIAASVLASNGQIPMLPANHAIIGELSLDGSVRPVRGIIGKLLHARTHNLCSFFVPLANLEQARLVPDITVYPVHNLKEFYDHASGLTQIKPVNTGSGHWKPPVRPTDSGPRLDDVIGQDGAKRALIIAAAGGHNLFLTGPPGTGKSMLAKTLPGLLPLMSHEEVLEVTHLNSLANTDYEKLSYERPLRSPHHSASYAAMVGGGQQLRPGEISLSHRGVLFLDEFPEFSRPTLEALRQPLEDQFIQVVRAKDSHKYPANFMLAATANPCPCGYNGFSTDRCDCTQAILRQYKNKLSGPIMDRIDLCCEVHQVDHKRLMQQTPPQDAHLTAQQQISNARLIQADRYGSPVLLNSDLTNRQLRKFARLNRPAMVTMQGAAHTLQLSARSYMRTIKVARTIADLEGACDISAGNISEALGYRQRPPDR